MHLSSFGVDLDHYFNHRQVSVSAAYGGRERQLRAAGSFFAGVSLGNRSLAADSPLVPSGLGAEFGELAELEDASFTLAKARIGCARATVGRTQARYGLLSVSLDGGCLYYQRESATDTGSGLGGVTGAKVRAASVIRDWEGVFLAYGADIGAEVHWFEGHGIMVFDTGFYLVPGCHF